MNCPKCAVSHAGPRNLEDVHHALRRVIERAALLPIFDARGFLRVHCLRIGLELSGFCANCTLNAQGDVAGGVCMETVAAVREAEQPEPAGAKVIELFPNHMIGAFHRAVQDVSEPKGGA